MSRRTFSRIQHDPFPRPPGHHLPARRARRCPGGLVGLARIAGGAGPLVSTVRCRSVDFDGTDVPGLRLPFNQRTRLPAAAPTVGDGDHRPAHDRRGIHAGGRVGTRPPDLRDARPSLVERRETTASGRPDGRPPGVQRLQSNGFSSPRADHGRQRTVVRLARVVRHAWFLRSNDGPAIRSRQGHRSKRRA